MRVRILHIVLLALLPQQSVAVQLTNCARSIDGYHFGESEHFDAGDGIVVFTAWASTHIGSFVEYVVSDCHTGQRFTVTAYRTEVTDDGREIVNFDDRRLFAARIDDMLGSENSFKFAELENEFQVADKRVSLGVSMEENCACRSLYPDLLNKKQRFKMEPWNE